MDKKKVNIILKILIKIIFLIGIVLLGLICSLFILLFNLIWKLNDVVVFSACLIIPFLLLPILFKKYRKKIFIVSCIYTLLVIISIIINVFVIKYDKSLVIKTDININTNDYLPFVNDTKIYKLNKQASLKFTNSDNLPILDGAAAVFPVYSAFVNAVYPRTVSLNLSPFLYTNTVNGYNSLAHKNIDIFFGAYPSEAQIKEAIDAGTEFEYTKIGSEAFVFFVNKDNPVDSLTTQQIKDIYSGKITNWKEVGGKNEKIVAFQRNEGSGSQSMFKRFMGDTYIMEPPKSQVNDFMSGIIEQVSDYKNYSNSIGFSFRYYLEGIIANPNVKMIKVDGVSPSIENISNGDYSITTPLYAVTYKGNSKENVKKLLDWILSEEGQEIIENTGYAGI